MFDLLKQAIFTSVGLANMGKEKLEQLAADISNRAQLTEKEAREFKDELAKRAAQARQNLEAEIDRRVDHAFVQMGIIKAGIKKVSETAQTDMQNALDQRIDAALERYGIARTSDLEALTHRIEVLEKRLQDSGQGPVTSQS